MKSAALLILLLLLPAALTAAQGNDSAESERTLAGTYTSAFNDRPNRVRATFEPTEETERWKARFDFSFNGTWRTWHGHAEGSFETGAINGLVRDENNNRAFTFTLALEKGKYRGMHSEVIGGRERKTGTISLR